MTTSGVVKSTTTSAPASETAEQAVALVDRRHQLEIVGGVDRLADLDAHPAPGTEHADPQRLGRVFSCSSVTGHNLSQSGRALRGRIRCLHRPATPDRRCRRPTPGAQTSGGEVAAPNGPTTASDIGRLSSSAARCVHVVHGDLVDPGAAARRRGIRSP